MIKDDSLYRVGDIVYTNHSGIYMISSIEVDTNKTVYLATTLDSDYIGRLCYYNEEHLTIESLLDAIHEEEVIAEIVAGDVAQKKLLDY